jgi:divalent metal cation (Fe/Co/Zn/Cd) transporter
MTGEQPSVPGRRRSVTRPQGSDKPRRAAHGTDGRSNVSRYTALNNPVLQTEGRVTLIDGLLAAAVLVGLVFNAALGWWRADPAAGYVLVYYAVREVWEIRSDEH